MKNRILVLCGDQYHPAEDVISGLKQAAQDHFEQADNLTSLSPNTKAIVLAKLNVASPTDKTPWADPTAENQIKQFIEQGKGLLVIHAGTAGYRETKEIRKLTGGAFLHHPEPCEVTYQLTHQNNPFTVRDEHYFVELYEGAEVFLKSTSEHGRQPAGWRKMAKAGRVSVLTPGHFQHVWQEPAFQKLIENELKWVTGE